MREFEDLLSKSFSDPIPELTMESIETTLYNLRKGETFYLSASNVITLGELIQEIINAIEQKRDVTFWTARGPESVEKILNEGLVNQRAIEMIEDNGRYDEIGYGSIYLRKNPKTAEIAKKYRNWLLDIDEEREYEILEITLILTGEYGKEEDYFIYPSVSSALLDPLYPNSNLFDINFVIRNMINCKEKKINKKTPFEQILIEIIGDFTYSPEEANGLFAHLPYSIRTSRYGSNGVFTP